MTLYLLDTNIMSNLIRRPGGRAAARIREVGEAAICTSVVVAAELRFGAAKRGSSALSERVEAVLARLRPLPLETPADRIYGTIRAKLEAIGQPIGPNDLLIAAHTMALGASLVTANESEFGRIDGLAVENWLA